MTLEQIRIVIRILQILIPILIFLFILNVALSYHPGKRIVKTYERVNEQLREVKNGFFDYENTERFLKANGAAFHYGKRMNPVRFLMLRLILSAVLFASGICLHWSVAVALTLLGFQLPVIWLVGKNKKDNAGMLVQIKNLYMMLVIQIQAGGTVTHVMSGIYRELPRGRLRTALEEMNSEIFITKDFGTALEHFNNKFSNSSIDSLCAILNQAQESGRAVELLNDMSEEIRGMKNLQNKKEIVRFKRRINRGYLGAMAGALLIIIYGCLTSIYDMAKNM